MADVTVATSAATGTRRAPRAVVWHPTDPLIGYQFFVASDSDFSYVKTTDGGATWGGETQIGPNDSDFIFDVWADWWTPGDTGTLIHCVWCGVTADDIFYRTIDIGASDALGTQRIVEAESSGATGIGVHCSITKAVGGNLYVSWECDVSGERGFERSTDGGATWTARTIQQEAAGDWSFLYPANLADTNDIWALYFDASANALTLKTYDDSANTWSESATIVSITENTTDLTGQYPFSASVRHSDGHLIVAAVTEYDTATADHRVFDITNGGSFAELTAITTNIDDHYYPSVFIDQATDDIYVAYNGSTSGAETLGTSTHIYYRKSSDGGSTWDAEVQYSEGSATAKIQAWVPLMGPRFYVTWVQPSFGLFYGNFVNSLDLSAAPPAGAVLEGAAAAVAVAAGALSTGIQLNGAAQAVGTAAGGLTTQIKLDGAAIAQAIAAGTLTNAGAALAGDAAAAAQASGSLSTGIPLAGVAIAVGSASGQITTAIPLAGAAAAVSSANGTLTAQIQLAGAAIAQALAAAGLTTGIPLAGAAAGQAAASGSLTIQIRLAGSAAALAAAAGALDSGAAALEGDAQSIAVANGSLTTHIAVVGASAGQAQASGSLSTGIALQGAAAAQAQASAGLSTGIPLMGAAAAVSTADGALTTAIAFNAQALVQALATGDLTAQITLDGAATVQALATATLSEFIYVPSANDDTWHVPLEVRQLRVAGENRTLYRPREDRTLVMEAA